MELTRNVSSVFVTLRSSTTMPLKKGRRSEENFGLGFIYSARIGVQMGNPSLVN